MKTLRKFFDDYGMFAVLGFFALFAEACPAVMLGGVIGTFAASFILFLDRQRRVRNYQHYEFVRRGVRYDQWGGKADCDHINNTDANPFSPAQWERRCLDCKAWFVAERLDRSIKA